MVIYTCPDCGSHNVAKSDSFISCKDCGCDHYIYSEKALNKWICEPKNSKKLITKQRVVRTYATANDSRFKATENLITSFNQGWRVVMCHPIGDRSLEYILEKECEE